MNEQSKISITRQLQSLILERDFAVKIQRAKDLLLLPLAAAPPLPTEQSQMLVQPGRPVGYKVVAPREVPSRRDFRREESRIGFLHAIANIELLAIELPALALCRFGCEDETFVHDQLGLIAEEAKHFALLKERLSELGGTYGALPVHHSLWENAWRCQSFLEHQIIIPCYFEARGVDATPQAIEAFFSVGDERSAKILQVIHTDEIGHVKLGVDYLDGQAKVLGESRAELYQKMVKAFFGGRINRAMPLNRESRRKAGFGEDLMAVLDVDRG